MGGEWRGSKFKIKETVFLAGEKAGGGGRGASVSDFFHKESKSTKKKKFFFFFLGGGGGGGGEGGRGGRCMDRRTGPNQFAPSTSSKLGHNNALMYKLCP